MPRAEYSLLKYKGKKYQKYSGAPHKAAGCVVLTSVSLPVFFSVHMCGNQVILWISLGGSDNSVSPTVGEWNLGE